MVHVLRGQLSTQFANSSDVGAQDGLKLAQLILWSLIFAIGTSPRFRISSASAMGQAVDVRAQDIILGLAIGYLFLARTPKIGDVLREVYGRTLAILVWGVLVVTAASGLALPHVSLLRRIAYAGRVIELIVLLIVVLSLFVLAGSRASQVFISAIVTSAILNSLWIGYQYFAGEKTTLFGVEVSNTIESYGPKLIGEPSAFGTGQFFVFVFAFALSSMKSGRIRQVWASLLMTSSLVAVVLSESRISLLAVVLILLVYLTMSGVQSRLVRPAGLLVGLLAVLPVLFFVATQYNDRLTLETVVAGVDSRALRIWGPIIEAIVRSPLVGVGPGGLEPELGITEAHSVFLRSLVELGLVFGPLWMVCVIRPAQVAYGDIRRRVSGDWLLHSYLAVYVILGLVVSGLLQDSLTAVMSSHLTMVVTGAYLGARLVGSTAVTSGQSNEAGEMQ